MKAHLQSEIKCDFCHRLLNQNESLDDWQSYATIDPGNVWYELLACPECKNSPKKRKESYSTQVEKE
jgi:phage FluMu protein Com